MQHRDTDALKEILEHHSVEGYEVVVPIFDQATIVEQGATGPVRHISPEAIKLGSPMVFYKVRAKTPVPFNVWVDKRWGKSKFASHGGSSTSLYDLSQIRTRMPDMLNIIPDYLMKRLEEGHSISFAQIEHDSLVQRGCIDPDDRVYCYTFWSNEVVIHPKQLKRGMLVEYDYILQDKEHHSCQGRIVGFMDKNQVALLELFTPLPYLQVPDEVDGELIKKGFYSEGTYAIGYGTYEAFEIAEEESGKKLIPEGTWDNDHRIYTLKDFMPLSVVQDLCAEAYGDQPHCLWQALIMYIVPIKLYDDQYKGTWRPLAERAVESDYVVSYDLEE
jgi:hypothetical protein